MPVLLQAANAEALTPALHAGLGIALQPEFLAERFANEPWAQAEDGQ